LRFLEGNGCEYSIPGGRATGTIGSAVVGALSTRHDVVKVSHKSGAFRVDLASSDSITQLFRTIGAFDALVSAAGLAKFGTLDELKDADYLVGLSNKLMGQANLVRIGRQFVNERGSFTLTSGVLSQEPMKGSASISMVNAGLEGFVRAAALELPRGIRVNVVCPPWITETLIALKMDQSLGMSAAQVAQAYVASVEGTATGQVIDPRKLAT
jgi:NAD(P)-dependent dehydrogenase (short-subunit alcohol dehydrogenase family)